MAPTIPTLQARKQLLVRDAIWDAATDLFAEKGFDEATIDDIAQRAGVSRRSFFRYFSSKSDLMAQGIVSYGAELTDAIDSFPSDAPMADVFRQTVLRIAQQSAAHPRTQKIMQIAAQYPAARAAQLSQMAVVQEQVAEAFARRRRVGDPDEIASSILAGLTISLLAVAFRAWFEQGQPDISFTVDQIFSTLSRLVRDEHEARR